MKINFVNLSIVRGLLALYVVVNHARGHLFAGGLHLSAIKELDVFDKINLALLQLTALGQEAVILFFVLSGFSIAHSLSVNGNIVNFLKNRFIRIYPPYLFSLLFVVLLANVFSYSSLSEDYLSYANVLKYLLYIKSDGGFTAQYWSLVYEVVFYLLAPIILLGRSSIIFLSCISVFFFSISYYFNNGELITSKNIFISFFSDTLIYFMIGVLAYKNFSMLEKIQCKNKKVFLLLVVFFFALTLISKVILSLDSKFISLSVAFFSVLIIVNVNGWDIKHRVLEFLGDISYSLYLNHFVVIVFVEVVLLHYFNIERSSITNFYAWLLVIPFCLIFSTVMWYFSERNCNLFLHKKRRRCKSNSALCSL